MKKMFFIYFCFFLFFTSCNNPDENVNYKYVKATNEIKQNVIYYANLYKEADTIYYWGAQDPLRAIRVDCSGFVYRCYQYAIENTEYEMILSDMSSSYMAENCYKTTNPEAGDLIFMGEENSDNVIHVAIYLKQENNYIYFIDATENETVSGVSERYYLKDSKKFKSFGVMKLKKIIK